MNNRLALTSVLAAALLPLAASAQSNTPNPDNPPPPPVIAPAPPAPTTAAAPGVPAIPPAPPISRMRGDDQPRGPYTFLGLETSRVPRVVSEQLGLPRGFGVVVDYVVPSSAAANAGLQQNDIVRMLNDQILIDPDQLGTLVRSFADGTTINLTVLRQGKEIKLTARLQQKQDKPGRGGFGYEWNFDGLDGLDSLKDMHIPDMSAVREVVTRARQEAQRAGDQAREAARKLRVVTSDDGTVKATHVDIGKAQIVYSDDQGELRLETTAGKRVLTAKDASGKLLFQGPIETDEERARVPVEVRKRYENLEHQELPPIPPNEDLAPRAPHPNESAHLRNGRSEQAALVPTPRSGWVRDTLLL